MKNISSRHILPTLHTNGYRIRTVKLKWCFDDEDMRLTYSEYLPRMGINPVPTQSGIRVIEVKRGMFDEAGVKIGDRIQKLANRTVRYFHDIETILFDFKHGDEIPIRIKRGSKILNLKMKVLVDDPCDS